MAADRNRLIKYIHMAAKSLGMDEDTRREMMAMAVGKRSCADMSVKELERVVAALHEKGTPPTVYRERSRRVGKAAANPNPMLPKIRALWLSLHALGIVRDPSDQALDRFQRDVTKVEAARWLTPSQAAMVIEALKSWSARPADKGGAGVDWSEHENPRLCVVRAQWRLLLAAGAIDRPEWVDAQSFGYRVTGKAAWHYYGTADFDRLIRALGAMVRKANAARAARGEGG